MKGVIFMNKKKLVKLIALLAVGAVLTSPVSAYTGGGVSGALAGDQGSVELSDDGSCDDRLMDSDEEDYSSDGDQDDSYDDSYGDDSHDNSYSDDSDGDDSHDYSYSDDSDDDDDDDDDDLMMTIHMMAAQTIRQTERTLEISSLRRTVTARHATALPVSLLRAEGCRQLAVRLPWEALISGPDSP